MYNQLNLKGDHLGKNLDRDQQTATLLLFYENLQNETPLGRGLYLRH